MEKRKNNSSHRETVPYIVYEGTIAHMERQIKRLWILLTITAIALVGSILIPRRDIIYEASGEIQTSDCNITNDKLIPNTSVLAEMSENHDKKRRTGGHIK